MGKIWQLQDAKNRLSELVSKTSEGSQTITRHGKPVAVVLSYDDYIALNPQRASGLVEFLRSSPGSELAEVLDGREKDRAADRIRDVEIG